MNWSSWAEFVAMGGYGAYVWGAYAVCLALMVLEPCLALRQHRAALQASIGSNASEGAP